MRTGMIDREKVIKKAERIMCSTVDRNMIDSFCEDVIALLKEQKKIKSQEEFSKIIHGMFDHLWDCEIEHPIFQDTVGDLMNAVIQAYGQAVKLE